MSLLLVFAKPLGTEVSGVSAPPKPWQAWHFRALQIPWQVQCFRDIFTSRSVFRNVNRAQCLLEALLFLAYRSGTAANGCVSRVPFSRFVNRAKSRVSDLPFCVAFFVLRTVRRVPKCSKFFCFSASSPSLSPLNAVELPVQTDFALGNASSLPYSPHCNCCIRVGSLVALPR